MASHEGIIVTVSAEPRPERAKPDLVGGAPLSQTIINTLVIATVAAATSIHHRPYITPSSLYQCFSKHIASIISSFNPIRRSVTKFLATKKTLSHAADIIGTAKRSKSIVES